MDDVLTPRVAAPTVGAHIGKRYPNHRPMIETFQAPHREPPIRTAVAPGSRPATARRRTGPPWWFALPAMLLFAFVVLVPSVRGIYYAFTDWDGLDPSFAVVGLRNFAGMLGDADAMQAVWHTLLIAVSITIIQNGLGL